MLVALVFAVSTLLSLCNGDCFMHNPRGSDNRLNENTNARSNNNRLFNSQNNNHGGYNVGDLFDSASGNDPSRQYQMKYYGSDERGSSKLTMEWTNQHGCGGNPKLHCNFVIQYMCMNNGTNDNYPLKNKNGNVKKKWIYMRDGTSTSSQGYEEPGQSDHDLQTYANRMLKNLWNSNKARRGLHETTWYYDLCSYREANGGLFRADRNLGQGGLGYTPATHTRQNNNGGRSGFECPEERDYFPYWAPTLQAEHHDSKDQRTPWVDLAWLGDTSKCRYIKANSFNRNAKYRCILTPSAAELKKRFFMYRLYGKSISEEGCKAENGKWVKFNSFIEVLDNIKSESACKKVNAGSNKMVWDKLRSDDASASCFVQAPEIQCEEAPWTRVNHLGNVDNHDGYEKTPNASRHEIELPFFPSGEAKRCVVRIRYNISTTDYDGWTTDHKSNNNKNVISNNPTINVFGDGHGLKLALNTAQTGRTFQDRSHIFLILPRTSEMKGKTIHNLNVRGKRGNIVDVYPAVEYDFIPNKLAIRKSELVHVQWTGSNTHNNKNRGDDGVGTDGTDRNNLIQMSDDVGTNYPLQLSSAHFWSNVESLTDPHASSTDIAVGLASSGYYCAAKGTQSCPSHDSVSGKSHIDKLLNNAPASYFGHVLKFKRGGKMNYLSSRNNNFSKRSQKGSLWVR